MLNFVILILACKTAFKNYVQRTKTNSQHKGITPFLTNKIPDPPKKFKLYLKLLPPKVHAFVVFLILNHQLHAYLPLLVFASLFFVLFLLPFVWLLPPLPFFAPSSFLFFSSSSAWFLLSSSSLCLCCSSSSLFLSSSSSLFLDSSSSLLCCSSSSFLFLSSSSRLLRSSLRLALLFSSSSSACACALCSFRLLRLSSRLSSSVSSPSFRRRDL